MEKKINENENKINLDEENNEEEDNENENENELKEEDFNLDDINEKFEKIISYLESINIDKEIGEKEKNKDTRLIIEKIELENFKSWAGRKTLYPLDTVKK
jgi:hypothetical protein